LEYHHRSRPAKSSTARMVLRKGSFGLGANSDFLRKRNHLLRTISSQPAPSSPKGSVHNRPERTQSQSDSERLERERLDRTHSHGPESKCFLLFTVYFSVMNTRSELLQQAAKANLVTQLSFSSTL
ncbi:hypothetical protein XENOCAPTIV_014888, partial [Xenoophorus captivus]